MEGALGGIDHFGGSSGMANALAVKPRGAARRCIVLRADYVAVQVAIQTSAQRRPHCSA